ncbi:MAG: hypothetical protein AAGD32_11310 [Planctomycetota bacterium]
MTDKPDNLFRWLGRQVGHVKRAVKPAEKVVYQREQVEEKDHPDDPNLTLRRTTKDEVVEKNDSGLVT